MNYTSFCELNFKNPKQHLSALETPLGMRSFGQSVAFCNRCGLCLQSCPFYILSLEEPFSPRGYNQTIRFLLKEGLSPVRSRKKLLELATSCTLCGRCIQACPGQVPTAQHILELRRLLGKNFLPFTLRRLMRLRSNYPKIFYGLARIGLFLRRIGIVKLLRFSGLSCLLGLRWINQMDKMIPRSSKEARKQWKEILQKKEENPSLIYIPSLETELFLPEVGINMWKLACAKHRPVLWTHTPTGLFEYVYGNLREARKQIKKLIERIDALNKKEIPILTDSIDVYNFFKEAASLFEEYPQWKERTLQFAQQVIFATDLFPENLKAPTPFTTPVALEYGALFSRQSKPFQTAEQKLHTLFAENFVQCMDRQADLPAFGYSFYAKDKATQIRALALRPLENQHVGTVVVLSGWAMMEASCRKRKMLPSLKVLHVAQLNG
ncbi:MAG: (Fe-S)-binding protein [Elusimicrobiaceae bacterium]|nr:(Fe-S)-binding protein [Elusimicrobiaceae bacterium]